MLRKLATGDNEAFSQLFTHYHVPLRQFIQRFVRSPDLSEDLSQEVFMKVWEKHQQMASVESFRSYLFIIARNHTLNFLRQASRHHIAIGEIIKHYHLLEENSHSQMMDKEYQQFIAQVLDSLPPQTRLVFKMCREQDMSYEEIANQLGISRNTVKKHMMRSNKTFRESMDTEMGLLFVLSLLVND